MKQLKFPIFVAAIILVLSCGGDDGPDVVTPMPVFVSDRPSPGAGEVFLVGDVVDRNTLLLHFEMIWPDTWTHPYSFAVNIEVPADALEPTSITGNQNWPDFGSGTPSARLDQRSATVWTVFTMLDGFEYPCPEQPPTWTRQGNVRFATVEVTIKQPGIHRIEVDRPPFSGGSAISECEFNRYPPLFGGSVDVP